MMIVIVTRDDLRDEFLMADDAFALSPISARATQPSEQDYDAIREAFMETARGRWFLGEYAKRNRNADTRMVLDAARAAASGAIDSLALEETLTPVRKGARVIREIAWRWREIGADGRICDLLDSQVNAIEGACGQIVSTDPKAVLSAAFDLIEARIAELDESDTASPQAAETAVSPPSFAASPGEMPAADSAMVPAAAATNNFGTATSAPALPDETLPATADAEEITADAQAPDTQAPDVQAPDVQATDAQAGEMPASDTLDVDAQDDAVLRMVALEMAAPDPSDIGLPADPVPAAIHAVES